MSQNNVNPMMGCAYLALLIVFAPFAILFVESVIPLATIILIGYVIFQLKAWDKETNNITNLFENTFHSSHIHREPYELPPREQELPSLPSPSNSFEEELKKLVSAVNILTTQNKSEQKERDEALIIKTIRSLESKISNQKEEELQDFIWGEEDRSSYNQSDEFEKRQYSEKKKKKIQELENREFQQSVNEQLFEQHKETHAIKVEVKEDNMRLETKMNDGFMNVKELLFKLQNGLVNLKGYFDLKFADFQVETEKRFSSIDKTILDLAMSTEMKIAETHKKIANVDLKYGNKVVELKEAQGRIVNQIGECKNLTRQFMIQAKQLKIEAERYQIRGDRIINQAQNLYEKHKLDMKLAGKDIEMGLEKISLHKNDFALKAGQAKLQLDKISQDQYLELKNIGFAEMGVKMLRQDFMQREELKQKEMQNLIAEKRRVEERVREYHSRGLETAQLRHRINMLDEKYQYANHTNSIMQREHNVFKRLSNS